MVEYNNLLGQLRTGSCRAEWMAAPFHGFRLSVSLQRIEREWRPCRIDDFPSHEVDRIKPRVDLNTRAITPSEPGLIRLSDIASKTKRIFVGDVNYGQTHGQRPEQRSVRFQQQLTIGRLTAIAGGRFVHNSAFGKYGGARVALTLLALRGGEVFSGTRSAFRTLGTGRASKRPSLVLPIRSRIPSKTGALCAPSSGIAPGFLQGDTL